ncbi:MAG: SRPBCC family protein [Actinomycetes bacterium]
MLIFSHEVARVLPATPQALFDVMSDLRRHPEIAGSEEVKALRVHGDRPIGIGTTFEADEEVPFGKKTTRFTAKSIITAYDPPRHIAWRSEPPGRPRATRVEWSWSFEPTQGGTRTVHRAEVEFAPLTALTLKPIYGRMRAPYVRRGMERSLDRLAAAVAGPAVPKPRADAPADRPTPADTGG